MTQNLYHITKERHLDSILKEGLKINSSKIGFCKKDAHSRYKKKFGMQPIFLTSDLDYITNTMLSNEWIKRHKIVVLKVNVELNETNANAGYFVGITPKEYRYFENIEPQYIEKTDIVLNRTAPRW